MRSKVKAIYRELKALGASEGVAKQVAGNCRRWWRNSDGVIKRVLTIAYFDRLIVCRLWTWLPGAHHLEHL
jgi:RNA-directed DNA polymerase